MSISIENPRIKTYDDESAEAGWDSPCRAQEYVHGFIKKDSKVLDIGIGTGQTIKGYVEKGAIVVGIDSDQSMLDVVGKQDGVETRLGDINEELPVDDLVSQVDVVQAIGVLEFARDLRKVMTTIEKVLLPGGVAICTIETRHADQPPSQEYPQAGVTVYRHTLQDVRQILDTLGFNILKAEEYGAYQRDTNKKNKVPYYLFLVQKQQN